MTASLGSQAQPEREQVIMRRRADRFYSSLGLAKVVTIGSLVVADADRYVPSGFPRTQRNEPIRVPAMPTRNIALLVALPSLGSRLLPDTAEIDLSD